MKISGFTFAHNALDGGYPIVESINAVRPYVDEIVAIDIESTDRTREVLTKLGCKVLDGKLNGTDTVNDAFGLHAACEGDLIIFFEADEVYDDRLLSKVLWSIERGERDIAVYRLQVEQNFQRVKQWPIPVHRIFPNGGGSYMAHPTNLPEPKPFILPPNAGYLWDCSSCFRDTWLQRKQNQIKLFGQCRPIYVPEHFTEHFEFWSPEQELEFLQQEFWEWTATPLDIPDILKPLLGKTRYEAGL